MYDTFLTKIACRYDRSKVSDIEAGILAEFKRNEGLFSNLPEGARIAVAVGSRGIANLSLIVRTVVRELKRMGARPFIMPAMGSHGGATAEGQAAILREYGIDEDAMAAPIVSSMETVELPPTEGGTRVFMSKDAFLSDGVFLVNRIKVHTDFHGEYESGLVKMSVIGLGKHAQALEIHGAGVRGLRELIVPVARTVIGSGKILCGLGIVENAYDETAVLRIIPAKDMLAEEKNLLVLSRARMPRIPTDPLDVLIVDEMGKDISGVGMDPNIIGRIRVRGQDEPAGPRISSIVVCDLTAGSQGNALGIGLADLTTRALSEKINYPATMENAVTSTFLDRAKIPLVAENPRRAVEIALRAASIPEKTPARIMRIKNTLKIHELYVSQALLGELGSRMDIEIMNIRIPLFDGDELFPCFEKETACTEP